MKLNLRHRLAPLQKALTLPMNLTSILNGEEVRSPAHLYELIQAMVTSGQWNTSHTIHFNRNWIWLGLSVGFFAMLTPMEFSKSWKAVFMIALLLTSISVIYLTVRFYQQASPIQRIYLLIFPTGVVPMLFILPRLFNKTNIEPWQLSVILWGFSLAFAVFVIRFAPQFALSFSKLINGGSLWLKSGDANHKVNLTNRLAAWLLAVAPGYSIDRKRNGLTAPEIGTIQAMAAVEQGGVDWRGVLFNLLALVGIPVSLFKLPEWPPVDTFLKILSVVAGDQAVLQNFFIALLFMFLFLWLRQAADFLAYLVFSEPANRMLQLACIQSLDALDTRQTDAPDNQKELHALIAPWGFRAEFTPTRQSKPPQDFTVVSVWPDYRRPGQFIRLLRRNKEDYS